MTHRLCPCCGYNLEAERAVVSGRVAWDGFVAVDGQPLAGGSVNLLIASLLHAWPRSVRREALLLRAANEDATESVLRQIVHHARRRLADLGVPPSIETTPDGYRWGHPVREIRAPEQPDRDAEIRRMRQNMPVRAIARQLNISPSTIFAVLARPADQPIVTMEQQRDQAIGKLYATTSGREIAERFGLSAREVRRIVRNQGVRKRAFVPRCAPGANPAGDA
jgi:DNA-binding winged helix-turn-helix (wHTH) protein